MGKPTIYLDTSIISAYLYNGSDEAMRVRRSRTREWWEWESQHFVIWASSIVEAELREGSFPAQSDCVKAVRRCRYLQYDKNVGDIRVKLLQRKIVPPQEPNDAAHLAICSVHGIDYLLTWNYSHMANSMAQARLTELCQQFELRSPLMVSPEMIPQLRFGQTIRRKK